MPDDLRIGGFTRLTTIDYPGELAAVVFCQGCPWRCRYCQNGHLLPVRGAKSLSWEEILGFLRRRRGLLDAVVFSGGEPTLQRGLSAALRQVRMLGFKTGLHTAGPWPERLVPLLPHLDWVGMDIKTTPADYPRITGVPGSGERAWRSARLLRESGVACQFRVTVHPRLTSESLLQELEEQLRGIGVDGVTRQECVREHCLDENLR